MPWTAEINGFGAHGFWSQRDPIPGPYDGIILNTSHLGQLEDVDFMEKLREAIDIHNGMMDEEIKNFKSREIESSNAPSMDSRRAKIWIRDQKTCRYCKRQISLSEAVAEHVMPKSRGGSDRVSNLVCSCERCNYKKGSRTPKEAGMHLLLLETK